MTLTKKLLQTILQGPAVSPSRASTHPANTTDPLHCQWQEGQRRSGCQPHWGDPNTSLYTRMGFPPYLSLSVMSTVCSECWANTDMDHYQSMIKNKIEPTNTNKEKHHFLKNYSGVPQKTALHPQKAMKVHKYYKHKKKHLCPSPYPLFVDKKKVILGFLIFCSNWERFMHNFYSPGGCKAKLLACSFILCSSTFFVVVIIHLFNHLLFVNKSLF